ncbi:MAG: hypothetical protein IJ958_03205 [Agathobacter sp.]|nr:hypothetical protein [Agathobacter sp.]
MKETIKHYFPLVLTVLGAIYAIYIIFHSIAEIGLIFENASQKDNKTYIAQTLATQLEEDFPTPTYIGNSLIVGEGYVFETLFELDTDSTTALYLVDVKASNNSSVLTRLSTKSIKSLDQLPSAAIYDSEQHRLYFHNSGIYTLLIRLYYDHRPGILFECQIPVEAR